MVTRITDFIITREVSLVNTFFKIFLNFLFPKIAKKCRTFQIEKFKIGKKNAFRMFRHRPFTCFHDKKFKSNDTNSAPEPERNGKRASTLISLRIQQKTPNASLSAAFGVFNDSNYLRF